VGDPEGFALISVGYLVACYGDGNCPAP